MDLLAMLNDKIEQLKTEWKQCNDKIEKSQIAYAINEMKILRYEYELKNGIIKIVE